MQSASMAAGAQSEVETRRIRPARLVVAALVCIAAGTWLYGPSLWMGFHLDDYLHLAQVQGEEALPDQGPLELFTFAEPRPDRMGNVQGDYLPWWRSERLLLRFHRPLASLSYHLDHALFGPDPFWFHVSSLVWYGLLVAACVVLYAELARISGRGLPTVVLAGLVYAVAREHEGNVAWLAGRYTLVSVLFCPLALLAYHRWRTTASRRALAWALGLYLLALLGSETPVALAPFFGAYEVSIARDGLRERLKGIAPVVLLVAGWLAYYFLSGHGTQATEWYLDPISKPQEFLKKGLGNNFQANLVRLFMPAALDPEFALHNLRPLVERYAPGSDPAAVTGLVVYRGLFVLLAVLAVRSVRDRTTRFCLVGALLSLVPLCAAPTPPRVLLLPTIATAWMLAALVADGFALLFRPRRLLLPWNLAHLALAAFLVLPRHDVLGVRLPDWMPEGVSLLTEDPKGARHAYWKRRNIALGMFVRAHELELPEGDDLDGARVLLLTAPTPQESLYTPLMRLQMGYGWPEGIWGISPQGGKHVLARTGERSFRLSISPEERPNGYFQRAWAGLFRDTFDFSEGTSFRLGVLSVTIAETDDEGRVFALEIEIDKSLDDPDVWLVTWQGSRWTRREPPPVGSAIGIPTVQVLGSLEIDRQMRDGAERAAAVLDRHPRGRRGR